MRPNRAWLLAVAPLALAGCVEREMIIRSDPAGAKLRLDHDEKGEIPADGYVNRFSHYGVREVVVSKPGYKTRTILVTLHRPLYQVVPIDFFAELLFPFTLRDRHEPPPIVLEPLPPNPEDLGKSAEAFRDEARHKLREGAPEGSPKPPEGSAKPPEATPSPKEPAPAPALTPKPEVKPVPAPAPAPDAPRKEP